jgi:trans-aconitate methyltransferase
VHSASESTLHPAVDVTSSPGLELQIRAATADHRRPPGPDGADLMHPQGFGSVAETYADDSFVARYAAVWAYGQADPDRLSEPYYKELVDQVTLDLPAQPRHVLDVGCGPGRVIADLAHRLRWARCTGIDASPRMIALAQSIIHTDEGDAVLLDPTDFGFALTSIPTRGRPDVELLDQSLTSYRQRERRHDLVVASHLLDRVPDPRATLDELTHLVSPGGRLVVTCAFNYSDRNQWTLRSAHDIAQLLSSRGFEVEHQDDDVRYVERLDIRGTATHHRAALVRARRNVSGE